MTPKKSRLALSFRSFLSAAGLLLAAALTTGPLDAANETRTLSSTGDPAALTESEQPSVHSATLDWEPNLGGTIQDAEASAGESDEAKVAPAPEIPLRRLLKKEITRGVALSARRIISEHHDEPFGTEIEFVDEGQIYVARIEEHYHPPGGQAKPWGPHPGVSVFVRRPSP